MKLKNKKKVKKETNLVYKFIWWNYYIIWWNYKKTIKLRNKEMIILKFKDGLGILPFLSPDSLNFARFRDEFLFQKS